MKLFLGALATFGLLGCAQLVQANYQPYEGRAPLVLEGQGGTKDLVGGYEVWANGTPPRRYEVLGVVALTAPDNPGGNSSMRAALAEKIKEAGGAGAIEMDSTGGGTRSVVGLAGGQLVSGVAVGRKTSRWQIVRYLDR